MMNTTSSNFNLRRDYLVAVENFSKLNLQKSH